MRMVVARYSWVEEDPIFENLLTISNLLVAKYIKFFEEEEGDFDSCKLISK